ncbi:acyltransferase ChoActase/COT/CPT [Hesseltinella vesiculosa]|uniref:Acyltransferase ChoActase/COT/CPT n=1 Tax=Hesseltinella vesiculosa TaxID=101127 RepID=A0A1X2GXE5_9FUNG|nr:acyltransferase ChoActase/COT/CPT [Hesseltinella vesiculosa]
MYSIRSTTAFQSIGQLGHVKRYTTKTFSNQHLLPRLPIPDLEVTAQRYKKSLIPLLTTADYQQAAAKVDAFITSPFAKELQGRLHALDEQEAKKGYSWLDQLWLNKGYLEYREPTMINVNWWMQLKDSPNGLVPAPNATTATPAQLERAAGLIAGLVDYSNRVNQQEIAPDVSRSGPFCMHQLKGVFSTTRIAATPADKVISHYPATAKHITVIYKDQLFSVDVIGPQGQVVPLSTLQNQLHQLVQQVDAMPTEQRQLPLGVLTSEHRDTWAKIREQLETNTSNAQTFRDLDTSLFAVCLDDYATAQELDLTHHNYSHGRNARNRWFDKGMQVIVETNAAAGINGEHSAVDAVVPLRAVDDVLKREPMQVNGDASVSLAAPRHLTWALDNRDEMKAILQTAEQNAKERIDDLDTVMLHYRDYGSNFMKRAKVSPDGWLQMAFQLAYYRHYGEPCATYESASTRKYLTGRTETVRSCSEETLAFTKMWDDKDVSMNDKLAAFERAVATQSEYMRAATNGFGVDRHLFGLYYQMTPEEAQSEHAAMFQDPSYRLSQYWKLSTSNTSPGNLAWGAFGPVVPDGYGCNYAIDKDMIRLSVSSCKHADSTDSTAFRKSIRGVLDNFAEVAERHLVRDDEKAAANH